MPRSNRNFKIGSIYHVINRGVEKRKIFNKPQDYSRFIIGLEFFNQNQTINLWSFLSKYAKVGSDPTLAPVFAINNELGEILNKSRQNKKEPIVEILAFVLMPNHYHFILREIKKGGISSFMKKMGGYSTYFNKQYKRVGPLFQSRFKAIEIENDEQLHKTFVYVHTNPVELIESGWKDLEVKNKKASIKFLNEYKWSSYPDYLKSKKENLLYKNLFSRDFFLKFFGSSNDCRVAIEDWVNLKTEIYAN